MGTKSLYFLHLVPFCIVLDVCRIAGSYWWSLIFRSARFCIAWFFLWRLNAWTQFRSPFHFVLLSHYLFAFDTTFFYSTSTMSKEKCLFFYSNFSISLKIIYFEHFDHSDTSHLTGQSSTLQYCRSNGGGCGHILFGTTIVFSPPLVTSWIHCTLMCGLVLSIRL